MITGSANKIQRFPLRLHRAWFRAFISDIVTIFKSKTSNTWVIYANPLWVSVKRRRLWKASSLQFRKAPASQFSRACSKCRFPEAYFQWEIVKFDCAKCRFSRRPDRGLSRWRERRSPWPGLRISEKKLSQTIILCLSVSPSVLSR